MGSSVGETLELTIAAAGGSHCLVWAGGGEFRLPNHAHIERPVHGVDLRPWRRFDEESRRKRDGRNLQNRLFRQRKNAFAAGMSRVLMPAQQRPPRAFMRTGLREAAGRHRAARHAPDAAATASALAAPGVSRRLARTRNLRPRTPAYPPMAWNQSRLGASACLTGAKGNGVPNRELGAAACACIPLLVLRSYWQE